MGETIIVRWTNANGAQSLQLLRERLERAYQASPFGRWAVQCRVYHSTLTGVQNGGPVGLTAAAASVVASAGGSSASATGVGAASGSSTPGSVAGSNVDAMDTRAPLYFIQSTSWPSQVYAVMSGRVVVAAGRELEAVLSKLRTLWVVRQSAVIEGFIYAMGDLLLRAGSLTVGQAHRGLVVELEYMASRTPGRCRAALEILLRDLLPAGAVWSALTPEELLPAAPAPTLAAEYAAKLKQEEAGKAVTGLATDVSAGGETTARFDTRSPPSPEWERLGLPSRECTHAHAAYLCTRLLQRDRLL
ncbi:TATA-binding related factor of subunit 20 of mediator complex-domain-containing protein [Thamnocephalis sphaerospora]|uniref:Mediator of RNA polymerase II transcription subunit 20 n=1 Tax=Thamnocephalis sphaerospora TaxID=78915 RepID=A0A4P9XRD3_9FUNG|nr:TATA-binding related factor of subunit 20 of mediator complex-domain-containing protein [Thamnocephalis sphaerospora]|eukprot:RKP08618.1 TATA-binding related factor of subunit 20 of mediator complex-domain-containing protein [Thamnocephalis sphaerospora]